MKPVNIGGHAAYQKHVLEQLCKYYPNALTSFDSVTWDIMEQFWSMDLSPVDDLMQDRYSVFGPEPRLPSNMLRSYLLSIKCKIPSTTAWASDLKQNYLHAILSGFSVGDTPAQVLFMIFSTVCGFRTAITSLIQSTRPNKSQKSLTKKEKRLHR